MHIYVSKTASRTKFFAMLRLSFCYGRLSTSLHGLASTANQFTVPTYYIAFVCSNFPDGGHENII